MTSLALRTLSRSFGDVAAVRRLNLAVDSGELVAFLGPSGCGKTTTLRMIAGLLAPDSGDILFDGASVLAVPSEKRGAVMVFQKHLLFPNMTVGQNVGFGLRMRGVDRAGIADRVAEMLALVQLPGFESRRPHQLSGGQQQRVALARALITRPRLLLLDEPLANLDANLRLEMRELICHVQRKLGITTIFVTHDQEEAVMMADRVALMFNGELLQFATPRTLYEQPASAAVARFFRNENFISGTKQGDTVITPAGTLRVAAAGAQPDGPVQLTIRPEAITLNPAAGVNCIRAAVREVVYLGTHSRVRLDVAGHPWEATASADWVPPPDRDITLGLPPERLWLWGVLPGQNSG
ncbi:MAG: ABC transporter ATP-binding protein [Anaerolineae bacterium]